MRDHSIEYPIFSGRVRGAESSLEPVITAKTSCRSASDLVSGPATESDSNDPFANDGPEVVEANEVVGGSKPEDPAHVRRVANRPRYIAAHFERRKVRCEARRGAAR